MLEAACRGAKLALNHASAGAGTVSRLPGAMAAAEYAKYIGDEFRRWEKFLAKNPGIMEH